MTERLLIIGCGSMGGAMLAGWLRAGMDPARFAILDPSLDAVPEGVALYRTPIEAAEKAKHGAVMLGFKPQQLSAILPDLGDLTGPGITVYSLLAGLTAAQLRDAFPAAHARVRVMPNLASRINRSPVILLGEGLDTATREDSFALFDALGTAVWLNDESLFDTVTALAGSGPGFVYRFIDALAEAATRLGVARDQADRLALAMVEGAALLAGGAEMSPGELADRVASPGGMTREGINVLDADDALASLLTRALAATRDRGTALSQANAPTSD